MELEFCKRCNKETETKIKRTEEARLDSKFVGTESHWQGGYKDVFKEELVKVTVYLHKCSICGHLKYTE